MNPITSEKRRYRTIWISDIHVGTRGCQAGMLLDFLKHTESESLYLSSFVGPDHSGEEGAGDSSRGVP